LMFLRKWMIPFGLILIIFTLYIVPNTSLAATTAIDSIEQRGAELVFGHNGSTGTLHSNFTLSPDLHMHSVHPLWDESYAVYSNNTTTFAADNASNKDLDDGLTLVSPEGISQERIKLPKEIEHPSRQMGLGSLVRDDDGHFWSVKQGSIREDFPLPALSHGTPSDKPAIITYYHSQELIQFDKEQIRLSLNIAKYLPQTDPSKYWIRELFFGGGVLYVHVGDSLLLALNPLDGSLLGSITLPASTVQIAPMTNGRVVALVAAENEQAQISILNADGTQNKKLELASVLPFFTASNYISAIYPLEKGEKFIIEIYGQWYTVDGEFTSVLSESNGFNPYSQGTCICPNISNTIKPLSENVRMTLAGNEIGIYTFIPIQIQKAGQMLLTDSPSYLDSTEGRVWVPLRATAVAMGIDVDYNRDTRTVTLQLKDRKLEINQDHPSIEMRTLKEYGKTYVSIRELATLLDVGVQWDQDKYTVTIDGK
jgi:hypothetical protein